MAKVIRTTMIVYLAISILGWVLEGDLGLLFGSGHFSLLLWAEWTIGAIIPLALLFSKLGRRIDGINWAAVFVIMGIFMNRLTVSWLGLKTPAWATYVPHWMEITISLGLIAGALLLFKVVARTFQLFPDHH